MSTDAKTAARDLIEDLVHPGCTGAEIDRLADRLIQLIDGDKLAGELHPVVVATLSKHVAEAQLKLATLRQRREEIPATRGAMVQASRISRQITQAELQLASWLKVVGR